eukprot:TRINITY_DN93452_c0_g1_i1.p1 TRINITY_DN93452_c0_g1~~TRINITY_DN93452_c0_g1_i1.p1  ORF type:complete len:328 (+),score=29.36 TRINITY_DN93452_c0_g1_i1:176-1159(+)
MAPLGRNCALLFYVVHISGRASVDGLIPAEGRTLLLVGQDSHSINGFVDAVGMPSGFSAYISVLNGTKGLTEPLRNGGGASNVDSLLQKFPDATALNLAIWMVGHEAEVASGDYDAEIDAIATWVKSRGIAVYLRPGYEFDGPWNHCNPSKFIASFRRFVTRFRALGVSNAFWVWHTAAASTYQGRPRRDWYPGDEYVNLFGLSVFLQVLNNTETQWLRDFARFAAASGKPLMICESTPKGYVLPVAGRTAWREWFRSTFGFVEDFDVRVFAYINAQWDLLPMWTGQGWGDTRIESNSYVLDQFRHEMTKPRWLASGALNSSNARTR